MTRRLSFSAGHRYWFSHLSEEQNRKLFGEWASPFSHGHNYVLDVEVEGKVRPDTGMIVNIKDVDAVLKAQLLPQFVNRSLNDEVPHFSQFAPTVENILSYIWREIERIGLPPECKLTHVRLEETPLLYGEFDGMTTSLTRIYEFAASHRLHAPALPQPQNDLLYGKCNNPAGHGHNYVLEVTVSGEPNGATGMLCSIDELDAAVNRLVVDRYDHKNLDVDVPELKGTITTSENVSQTIFQALDANLPATLERVRLWETARNMFEVTRR